MDLNPSFSSFRWIPLMVVVLIWLVSDWKYCTFFCSSLILARHGKALAMIARIYFWIPQPSPHDSSSSILFLCVDSVIPLVSSPSLRPTSTGHCSFPVCSWPYLGIGPFDRSSSTQTVSVWNLSTRFVVSGTLPSSKRSEFDVTSSSPRLLTESTGSSSKLTHCYTSSTVPTSQQFDHSSS